MNTVSQPQSNVPLLPATTLTRPADELPAKMPLAPLMDADTAPVMDVVTQPAIGDTVRYYNNTEFTVKQYFSGTIIDMKHSIILNSIMYRVQPDADDRLAYLGAVWVMPYQLEGQEALDPVYDQLPALREIEAAYVAWETAYLAGRYEEAARLDMIHRKLEDAHHERLYGPRLPSPKNSPQTPHKPIPAAVDEVQAFASNLDQKSPEIASEPFAPLNAKNDHPLALIEPGSVAAKTDWDALKAKRTSQFAEAYLRIYGMPFERKQAAGGAK